MTLAVELAIVVAIREVKPPFSPEAVVAELAQLLKSYRIDTVVGDRFVATWRIPSAAKRGRPAEPNIPTRTDRGININRK
jgi:hypothetical protein